jgi:hypothetical protein
MGNRGHIRPEPPSFPVLWTAHTLQHKSRTRPFQGVLLGDVLFVVPARRCTSGTTRKEGRASRLSRQHQKQFAIISYPHVGIRNVVVKRLISGCDVLWVMLKHLVTKWPGFHLRLKSCNPQLYHNHFARRCKYIILQSHCLMTSLSPPHSPQAPLSLW